MFGPLRVAETGYAPRLCGCLCPGMLLPAGRNFAVTALIEQITDTGAGTHQPAGGQTRYLQTPRRGQHRPKHLQNPSQRPYPARLTTGQEPKLRGLGTNLDFS
ncbi:hypothetical protein AB0M34_33875 [Nocardia sp. NPDC050193]